MPGQNECPLAILNFGNLSFKVLDLTDNFMRMLHQSTVLACCLEISCARMPMHTSMARLRMNLLQAVRLANRKVWLSAIRAQLSRGNKFHLSRIS